MHLFKLSAQALVYYSKRNETIDIKIITMKKVFLILALISLPFVTNAQMPIGMNMPAPQELSDQAISSQTDQMAAAYGLDEDQASRLLRLNKIYLGKIKYPVVVPDEFKEAEQDADGSRQEARTAEFDPTKMSDDDFQNMMSMMADMEDLMAQMEENQDKYETALQTILDKKQLKAWKKDKRHYETEQRLRMEQEFAINFNKMSASFGGDGFGGGFGGDFGGGFGF